MNSLDKNIKGISSSRFYRDYSMLVRAYSIFESEMTINVQQRHPGYTGGLKIFADCFRDLGKKCSFEKFNVLSNNMAQSIESTVDFWETNFR